MRLPSGRTAKLAVGLAILATIAQAQVVVNGFGGFGDGAAGTPSVFFSSDPTLGFFRRAASILGITVAGTQRASFGTYGIRFRNDAGANWANSADPDASTDLTIQISGAPGATRIFNGTTPTQSVATCGGAGIALAGNNTVGSVVLGAAPSLPCTIVFNGTWTNAPKCVLNPEILTTGTTTVRATSITTTGFVITSTAALVATDKVSWLCFSS